ncbi:DNA/RNA non-specific endonuclease [Vibrio parahaemolyticus]|uniref:DNA/RNA non-specific endonuclease n=1 Tax=Vibrio parahaemolyticus TaxID=670 RepID=UPI000812FE25|nr:DNA/RNA non-specific endonuclease [Vibrio parahaemolyticus]OCP68333.1 hypothetical protein AKH08_16085 [Vibrio parahaemolyticus]
MKGITTAIALFGLFTASAHSSSLPEHIKVLDYSGFNMLFDCQQRAPIVFQMVLTHDTGYTKRKDNFKQDPHLDSRCQQSSSKSYGKRNGTIYHRGHLISANSQDSSRRAMNESFFMVNVVPQAGGFNTGAWLLTEQYEECLRENGDIKVMGGVMFSDPTNDYFIKSHGIKTPDTFWKIIQTHSGYYAWAFPNSDDATKTNITRYAVTYNDIQKLTGLNLDLNGASRLNDRSLPRTEHCDLG